MSKVIGTGFAALLLIAGCGVPAGKTLSELSSDDREQICQDIPKEDAVCEGYGAVTRNRSQCEQLLASVNSVCDVTVEEYNDAMDSPVCSMLEQFDDWESCFGEPEEEEPIIINTNNSTGGNNDGGGPTGTESGRLVVDLSTSETEAICADIVDPRTVECDDGFEAMTATEAQCVDAVADLSSNCNATVGQLETCFAAEPCDLAAFESACQPIFDCGG